MELKRLLAYAMLDNAGMKGLLAKELLTPVARRDAVEMLMRITDLMDNDMNHATDPNKTASVGGRIASDVRGETANVLKLHDAKLNDAACFAQAQTNVLQGVSFRACKGR